MATPATIRDDVKAMVDRVPEEDLPTLARLLDGLTARPLKRVDTPRGTYWTRTHLSKDEIAHGRKLATELGV